MHRLGRVTRNSSAKPYSSPQLMSPSPQHVGSVALLRGSEIALLPFWIRKINFICNFSPFPIYFIGIHREMVHLIWGYAEAPI